MQSFWEEQHRTNNNYWLTGSPPIKVLKMHGFNPNIKNKTILDIGVGKGRFAQYISKNNSLIAVDISKNALKKVKKFGETYHVSNLSKTRQVDIAICHLVFQHCDDKTIANIINDVQLKSDGVFSFQFAFLREEPNQKVKNLIKKGTHYFRSLEQLKQIIDNNTDKKILNVSKPMHFYKTENFSWYFVKVNNK